MNRIQQNECLVQLPNNIPHLPECVPELFWLAVSKCNECICLLKFRASFQTLRVWVECIKHPTLYPRWQIVPGNDSYLSLLEDYCCKAAIGNGVVKTQMSDAHLYEKIRSLREQIKLPECTPVIVCKWSNKLPWLHHFLVCLGKYNLWWEVNRGI